jgi:hypothetical protein
MVRSVRSHGVREIIVGSYVRIKLSIVPFFKMAIAKVVLKGLDFKNE